MAGDNDVYAEGRWIDLQRLEVVKQEEPMQPASILGKPAVSSNRHSKKRQEGDAPTTRSLALICRATKYLIIRPLCAH
jgi:hypothetical protein